MNAAPLELSHNLLQTIDSLFVENNISKYFKGFFTIILTILFLPVLYISFWIIAIFISLITYKICSRQINFNDAEEYRQNRITYDRILPIIIKQNNLFHDLKEKSRILYIIFYPLGLIFAPFKIYCNNLKKEFEKLDKPTKEGDIFETITEQEMWEERPSAYEYRI